MFSLLLFRFSNPYSCLVLLLFLYYFHHLPCGLSQRELRICSQLFHCGTLTVGFSFWGVSRPEACGHPSLALHCHNNKTTLVISGQMYHVLQLDNSSNTLRLARQDFLGESFCDATFSGTTLTPELFELLPEYKTLFIHYVCNPLYQSPLNFTCLKLGYASVHQDNNYDEHCGASFNITVPTSYDPEEYALNLTHLGSVLRNGFEAKLKIDERPCQECQITGGICGYNISILICCKKNSSSEPKCTSMILSASTVDERHRRCFPGFTCSKQLLNYPFRTPDEEECGHSDFKVNCSGDFPEFSISSSQFQILNMNFHVITLARMDYRNNLCPQFPENATIPKEVLPFNEDTELGTFYYNCSDPREDLHLLPNDYITELKCKDVIGGPSYFVSPPSHSGNTTILDRLRASCERIVIIPVSRSALRIEERLQSLDTIKKTLEEGFKLNFNSECSQCIMSGGACGHNESSRAFICFCKDKPQEQTCQFETEPKSLPRTENAGPYKKEKSGLSPKQKLGIGLACGFLCATLLAGCVLCFFIRRRKRLAGLYTSKGLSTKTTPYSSNNTISNSPTSTTLSGSNHSLVPSMSNLEHGSAYFGVQVFSYEELEEATENFSKELGDGGFGTVYYGTLKDGRAVAVKRLYERSIKRVEQFKNEIDILKSLKHQNLVILYGCTTRHSRELLLVYEYISNGTLAEHLHGNQAQSRPLCWLSRLRIAIETANALSFLHSSGIIHRDVKTTNILLDSNYQVKVADFGLSRLFPMDQTHISTAPQGTPGYVDPEYYQCYRLNEKSDVYSYGVVLSELISSKEAVDITRHRQDINLANMAISKIQNDAVHELADLSLGFARDPSVKKMMSSVAELAFRCLQQEREVRPSMDEIVEVLKGIQKVGIRDSSLEVDEIDVNGRDDDGLLKHFVPPPVSPATDKMTSSSDTTLSSF